MNQSYEYKNTILKVENVSLKLGDTQILRDCNVDIRDVVRPGHTTGQIIGFLAPSGMGKTKFFECLSGIRKPDTGTVLIGEGLKPTKIGRVGVVQQNYPLFMNKTVGANMRVAARNLPKSERADRINDILTRFGLADRKGHYPAMLSGGQKQRAAIAQQLLCSNNFLLMDEPFSGLDVNMIKEVSDIIKEVAHMHELNTIIIVSHDIPSTLAISDTIWMMGRDRDENNNIIPGAKIKYKYNLMKEGLAWDDNVEQNPRFNELLNEIKGKFPYL
jgi:polar amino acid transport system ATP-binding protein/sulfate transport system ATP-binding protein